jgi:hypothetical protein
MISFSSASRRFAKRSNESHCNRSVIIGMDFAQAGATSGHGFLAGLRGWAKALSRFSYDVSISLHEKLTQYSPVATSLIFAVATQR